MNVLTCLGILLALGGAATFKEEPTDISVSTGETVVMKCSVSAHLLWWNVNGSKTLSYGSDILPDLSLDQFNRYSITGNTSFGEYYLTIKNVSLEDSGFYVCRFKDGYQEWHSSRYAELKVVQNSPECLMHQTLPVSTGDKIVMSCRSYSLDPCLQLMWLSKERVIPNEPSVSTQTVSIIQYVLTENDYNVSFVCIEATTNERKTCHLNVPIHVDNSETSTAESTFKQPAAKGNLLVTCLMIFMSAMCLILMISLTILVISRRFNDKFPHNCCTTKTDKTQSSDEDDGYMEPLGMQTNPLTNGSTTSRVHGYMTKVVSGPAAESIRSSFYHTIDDIDKEELEKELPTGVEVSELAQASDRKDQDLDLVKMFTDIPGHENV